MAKNTSKIKTRGTLEWKRLVLEMIVVFLGVTAGFLLNNWQQHEKDEQLKQKYLDGFLQDVQSNIAKIEESVTSDSLWLNKVRPNLLLIRVDSLSADSAETLLKMIISISKIDMQTGTYQSMTNSGNLSLINNYELKKQIVDYHLALEGIEFIDNYFYRYFGDFVMPFIFDNYNVLENEISDLHIIKSTRYANVVTGYFSMVQQRKKAYGDVLKKSYQLRNHLQSMIR